MMAVEKEMPRHDDVRWKLTRHDDVRWKIYVQL